MAARRKPINGQGHSSLNGIYRLVLNHLADQRIPGATVAVGLGSRVVYNKGIGYANYTARTPMLPVHRTWSGSTGKMFTVAAVMQQHSYPGSFNVWNKMYAPGGLYDTLDFRNAIDAVLAQFPATQADIMRDWYYKIRVSHLLSHCGGFVGGGNSEQAADYFGVDLDQVSARQNHLWFIRHRPLGYRPEMVTDYSNRSVGVMDHVIKTVSGQHYKDYVRSKILAPLGLDHVASLDEPSSALDARPHKYLGDDKVITPVALTPKPGSGSSGGWRTSASDLVRLMMGLDQLRGRSGILSSTVSRLMEKQTYNVPGARGLGWAVKVKGDAKMLSHSGSAPSGGASCMMRFTPGYIAGNGEDISNLTVAATFNIQNSSGAINLLARIARLVGAANVPSFYDLQGPGSQLQMAAG